MKQFSYKAYGLRIKSNRAIDLLNTEEDQIGEASFEWINGEAPLDKGLVEIKEGTLQLLEELTFLQAKTDRGTRSRVIIHSSKSGDLTVDSDETNSHFRIYYSKDFIDSDLDSYFVGPILSLVVRLRGGISLHSSSVAIGNHAAMFVGHSTAGKSTTAAALSKAGGKILADDISALSVHDGNFFVEPGYTKVRLRPIAANHFAENPESLRQVYSDRDSFYYAMDSESVFERKPMPLGAIYFLGNADEKYKEPFVKEVPKKEALLRLLVNASGSFVVHGEKRTSEFEAFSKLAETIPMRDFFCAHDISTIGRQCEIILEDFHELVSKK